MTKRYKELSATIPGVTLAWSPDAVKGSDYDPITQYTYIKPTEAIKGQVTPRTSISGKSQNKQITRNSRIYCNVSLLFCH